MTNKLPEEIHEIIKKVSIKIWHLKNDDLPPLTAMEQFDNIIIEHLGPYLSISKEEEPIQNSFINGQSMILKGQVCNAIKQQELLSDKPTKIKNIIEIGDKYVVGDKLNQIIDTINTQQEQIDYLLGKQS